MNKLYRNLFDDHIRGLLSKQIGIWICTTTTEETVIELLENETKIMAHFDNCGNVCISHRHRILNIKFIMNDRLVNAWIDNNT